jgi:hypothetical protein
MGEKHIQQKFTTESRIQGAKRIQCKKMCTHICKCKNGICWNYSGSQEQRMKENGWGGEFMSDIFDTV